MNGAEIWVNGSYQTSYPSIYAIGDVTGECFLPMRPLPRKYALLTICFGKKRDLILPRAVPAFIHSRRCLCRITADEAKKIRGRRLLLKISYVGKW